MSDPYLLAASLLTVGPISAPPPPVPPLNLSDQLWGLFAAIGAEASPSVATHEIVPIVETSSPEFSQPPSRRGTLRSEAEVSPAPRRYVTATSIAPVLTPNQLTTELVANSQTLPKPQSTVLSPTSGSQLYQQRLAALRAGKLYTRLSADSFQSVWAKGRLTLQQPTHEQWKRLLEQEAKAVAKGQGSNRLNILVGDSLTMWFPSQRLPYGQLWLNQGISGENSSQVLRRLSAFSQTRPDTIYVMAGINDLRQGVSDPVILSNLRQIMRRLRLNHPQSQIVVQSILPTRLSAIPNERIRNLNEQIGVIAQQEGAGFLNLHTLFADNQGQLQQDLTTDGLHLARPGYEVWQDALNYAESVMAANRVN